MSDPCQFPKPAAQFDGQTVSQASSESTQEKISTLRLLKRIIVILVVAVSLSTLALVIVQYRSILYHSVALGSKHKAHLFFSEGRFTFCIGSVASSSLAELLFERRHILLGFESLDERNIARHNARR